MPLDPLSDEKIVDSWHRNATPWTAAIRESRIESRKLVTNQAIIDAVLSRAPKMALDIGCGEGWLARALSERGIRTIGVDVVPALIDQAKRAGGGDFRVMSYEAIAAGELEATVDVAIANFSLIGRESVDNLVRRAPDLLARGGALVVQTLHPVVATGDAPYVDGWRTGSWTGFSEDFTDPAPWYFRTLQSWIALFIECGLRIVELREPIHPATGKPASAIFIGEVAG